MVKNLLQVCPFDQSFVDNIMLFCFLFLLQKIIINTKQALPCSYCFLWLSVLYLCICGCTSLPDPEKPEYYQHRCLIPYHSKEKVSLFFFSLPAGIIVLTIGNESINVAGNRRIIWMCSLFKLAGITVIGLAFSFFIWSLCLMLDASLACRIIVLWTQSWAITQSQQIFILRQEPIIQWTV